ncbi:hypothetical protein [Aurantiacibacter rhizosphaerae]|uniref:Uncharacterized protein n=1 Tax=Aurantiacibacter rhizosphaerae TaxID=2691582 RepID=A0A844XD92_9SPHN|nr:hypothetical protein [Aurantiacibacter rhizosphaerae]MWV28521.1 hypothetical protein [Aurantiacibacter rhizosphaerae]
MVQVFRLLPLALFPLVAACAATGDEYPSLSTRDIERTGGVMEVEPAPPPPQPAPEKLATLDELAATARAAHAQFLAAAPRARSLAASASGAAPGSERWAVAQVAIADLESKRSEVMIALADIDRIFVEAATSAQDTDSVTAVRTEIDALVAEENAVISGLLATVGR